MIRVDLFFDQLADLLRVVPHFNLFQIGENVNSDYCNAVYNSKDSYLSFSNVRSEGSLYCKNVDDGRDCTDCFWVTNSELLYDCVSVTDSYKCAYCTRSEKCSECYLGRDLADCQNCFGCVNLKHKQYCWYNEQLTADEYTARLAQALSTDSSFANHLYRFEQFAVSIPCEYATIRSSESATGNQIYNAHDIRNSFFINESENIGESLRLIWNSKDSYRVAYGGSVEGCHESCAMPFSTRSLGCFLCEHCSFLSYCFFCQNTDSSLGCTGLRKRKFCILNTQYSESEYVELSRRIIQDMRSRGEWGSYLSPEYSQHGYNETLAADYFPLSREEVIKKTWRWQDDVPGVHGKETLALSALPQSIDDVEDSISNAILACQTCGTNFKILKKELARLTLFHLPVPRDCPNCRFKKRLPRSVLPILYSRHCMCTENHLFHFGGFCRQQFETTSVERK